MGTKLAFDPQACTECRTCELTCSFAHLEVFNRAKSGIRITPAWPGNPSACFCLQCEKPDCVEACPVEALSVSSEGTVLLDADLCTACGACVSACPFNAIFLPDGAERVFKCDTCLGRFECVSACTTGALSVVGPEEGE